MKILLTGGGTGGHIYPIIAIIRELKRISPQGKKLSLSYVGPRSKLGIEELKKEGVVIKTIPAGKIRRHPGLKAIFQNIIDILFKIPAGILSAVLGLKAIKPDLIFSKGGYGSLPIILANKIFKFPLFIHESDSVPGKATKIASKEAIKIFTSFPITDGLAQEKIIQTGNPIRASLLLGSREEAKKLFNLTDEKPVVLILGGSQGAKEINELVLAILPDLLKIFEIIHQCGDKNFEETDLLYRTIVEDKKLDKYYHLYGYLDEPALTQALAAAHIVVSRAGAAAIFEIAALGKPSILVPLPKSAQDHQAKNAYLYAQNGAAKVMEPQNPTPHMLYSKLIEVFSSPQNLKQMQEAALDFAKPEAATQIAKYLLTF